MTVEQAAAFAFLAVSGLSLSVQTWAFHRLNQHRIRGGVWRTAACRVGCAVIYIVVGANALVGHFAALAVSLGAFAITQGTWAVNSVLDVRQGRRRATPMAYAPQAILDLFGKIHGDIPSAVNSGVVGDVHHSFGYHLARNELPGGDYSVVLAPDRQGDASAASALDISLDPQLMITVTSRLLNAAKARDPRLASLREFCGTTDGRNTHPYDLSNGQDGPLNSWDSSHLWHVHLSFYRRDCNNAAVLAPVADVIAGKAPTPVVTTRRRPSMYFYFVKELGGACFSFNGKFVRQFGKWPDVQNGMASVGQAAIYPMTREEHDALVAAASRTD